eukprot:6194715-Pleurochrysis_carterae.AAC.4
MPRGGLACPFCAFSCCGSFYLHAFLLTRSSSLRVLHLCASRAIAFLRASAVRARVRILPIRASHVPAPAH